jgi:hypothetical protein
VSERAFAIVCLHGDRLSAARDELGRAIGTAAPELAAYLAWLLESLGVDRVLVLPTTGDDLEEFLAVNGLDPDGRGRGLVLLEERTTGLEDCMPLAEGLAPRVAAGICADRASGRAAG